MPTLPLEYSTAVERLGLEQAIACFTPMRRVAATAPAGSVLAAGEQVARDDGRRWLRDTLASAVPSRADGVAAPNKGSRASAPKGGTAAG